MSIGKERFPWYDSLWLENYEMARFHLRAEHPEKLAEFERRLAAFKTRKEFTTQRLGPVLEETRLETMRNLVRSLKREDLEFHEFDRFGRLVVHDHPGLSELHKELAQKVSAIAGEPVEPSYNFLCMYQELGACPLHLDDPSAKWTLDICLSRSVDWPLYISEVRPWPEFQNFDPHDWEKKVRKECQFQAYDMKPGEGVLFSGSSQWHYREPLKKVKSGDFCDLIFLHYRPKGQSKLYDPSDWAESFGVPGILS